MKKANQQHSAGCDDSNRGRNITVKETGMKSQDTSTELKIRNGRENEQRRKNHNQRENLYLVDG